MVTVFGLQANNKEIIKNPRISLQIFADLYFCDFFNKGKG